MMETATGTPLDNHNAVDNINNAVHYNTDAQSVQSGATHGTIPQSPARTAMTPPNSSPASHNVPKSIPSHIPVPAGGVVKAVPQLRPQQSDDFWQVLGQQRSQQGLGHDFQQNRQRSNPISDDDATEPSSSANTRENNGPIILNNGAATSGYTRSDNNTGATSTFGRLVKSTTKTANGRNPDAHTGNKSAFEEGVVEGVLIYGYLQKLNRNGKWQTRWFETDGECLTYFKSSKRVKLLASLDLAKVGSIIVNQEDEDGCGFTINIAKRPYHLRADSKTAMKDWVITLNRVKEARMQEGNVKLVMPTMQNQPPIDLLDDQNFVTPRVVVVANRQRTHAVEDDDFQSWETTGPLEDNFKNDNLDNSSGKVSMARWQKPKTSLSHLASKVLRWARSLKNLQCLSDAENQVVLNRNMSTDPTTPSVSTTQSHQQTVPTADLLQTGDINQNTKNVRVARQLIDDDDDDPNAARFLS